MIIVPIVGDLHSGHMGGVTPPQWWSDKKAPSLTRKLWDWWKREAKEIGKADALILMGDMIDGPGRKDTKLHVTTDTAEQREMAYQTLSLVDTKSVYGVRGTSYHVTDAEEEEDQLIKDLGGKIYNELDVHIGGKLINVYHAGRRSDTPKGQPSALWAEMVRKQLIADRLGEKSPDVILRAHVHYFFHVESRGKHAVSCPAMELPLKGSYIRGKHTQYYDVGYVIMEIDEKTGEVFFRKRLSPVAFTSAKGVVHVK
jgi:hypothetical protein